MHRQVHIALMLALALAACSADVPAPAPAPRVVATAPVAPVADELPARIATFSLIADSGSIVPGQRTWLGARFQIAPGWHVYGKDPGDAGMPTRVTIEAPPGLRVGPAEFPPTKRYVDAGDIVTHGYEREVVLHIPVDADASLAPGQTLTLRARGSWLACKEQCVKESGDAVLSLQSGTTLPAPAESVAIFARFPVPASTKIPSP